MSVGGSWWAPESSLVYHWAGHGALVKIKDTAVSSGHYSAALVTSG